MDAVFFELGHYEPNGEGYSLLPFRFMEFDGRTIVVNEVGEHCILDSEVFAAFVSHTLPDSSETYYDLKAKHFLNDSSSPIPQRWLALKYRTKRSLLAEFT